MIQSPAGYQGDVRVKRYLDFYQAGYGVAMLSSGVAFSPLSLFANGEQGAWYDPSDFSTMFQDSAGTTPVTAVEQPVGLLLDKSKGLTLGSELVTNGDFSSSTGWTLGTGWTISGGTLNYSGGYNLSYFTAASNAFVAGRYYRVTMTISGNTSGNVNAYLNVPNNGILNPVNLSGNGEKTFFLLAGVTCNGFHFVGNSATGAMSIDNISVRELPGNHASQSTAASRPVLKQDGNGKYYLFFDGVDDSLATGTIDPGSVDKAQVFAGVRKLSDAAAGCLTEFSANSNTNTGTFAMFAPSAAAANYFWRSYGNGAVGDVTVTPYAAPITNVLTGQGAIATDLSTLRVNGAQVGSSVADQGTGNFGSYPLYIGRRGGSSLPFNGNLYSMIVRFSAANLSDAQIASTETWVNGKTGAY